MTQEIHPYMYANQGAGGSSPQGEVNLKPSSHARRGQGIPSQGEAENVEVELATAENDANAKKAEAPPSFLVVEGAAEHYSPSLFSF